MRLHRETPHFIRFNNACEKYLFQPRTRCIFEGICPEEKLWVADIEKEDYCVVCLINKHGIVKIIIIVIILSFPS